MKENDPLEIKSSLAELLTLVKAHANAIPVNTANVSTGTAMNILWHLNVVARQAYAKAYYLHYAVKPTRNEMPHED